LRKTAFQISGEQEEAYEPAPYIESCCICRKEFQGAPEYFLPLYEGEVVNADKTDDWAAMPCCEQCYFDHQHMWGHDDGQ